MMPHRKCRFCEAPLSLTFADLGMSPLSNAYLKAEQLNGMERFYPLHAWVCESCYLVQLEEFESPRHIFGEDYAYFSSYSDTWLEHARRYTELMMGRLGLGPKSHVVELASNDGYLLQYFKRKGIPVLGIEPAANVAAEAERKGVPTLVEFFGTETARELAGAGRQADLLIGNNVLAHVPALNDFVAGMAILLKPGGVITLEFPHLLRLMEENQFDTIYHEHFSYFSFCVAERVFAAHGLTIFDVEEISTHGGSLRIFAKRASNNALPIGERVAALRQREQKAGLDRADTYYAFAEKVKATKRSLLRFLIGAREAGKCVVGYGAPAKGNTLLNYFRIGPDMLEWIADKNVLKQGRYTPGMRIPVVAPERVMEDRPDYLLILAWNFRDEILAQHADYLAQGGKFIVPIPRVEIIG